MSPEELKKDCEICRDKVAERFSAMDRRLTTLEVTLWGQRGDNGLRAALNDLRRKMDMLLRFFWVATSIPAIAVGVIALLKFMGRL
jgi:hypothetical protein